MEASAVLEWHQAAGTPVLCQRNPWLEPVMFLSALAEYVHHARCAGRPLDGGDFRSWAAEHAHYVLGGDVPATASFLGPWSDVQFHYLVQVHQVGTADGVADLLNVTVRTRNLDLRSSRCWEVTCVVGNDDELFVVAADLLDDQIGTIHRGWQQGRGGQMPSVRVIAARAKALRAYVGSPADE